MLGQSLLQTGLSQGGNVTRTVLILAAAALSCSLLYAFGSVSHYGGRVRYGIVFGRPYDCPSVAHGLPVKHHADFVVRPMGDVVAVGHDSILIRCESRPRQRNQCGDPKHLEYLRCYRRAESVPFFPPSAHPDELRVVVDHDGIARHRAWTMPLPNERVSPTVTAYGLAARGARSFRNWTHEFFGMVPLVPQAKQAQDFAGAGNCFPALSP